MSKYGHSPVTFAFFPRAMHGKRDHLARSLDRLKNSEQNLAALGESWKIPVYKWMRTGGSHMTQETTIQT